MWKKPEETTEAETIIGPSVHLEGNFTSQGNIQIAGSLAGSLQTTGNVSIWEGAKVHANVVAQNVMIAGEVRGDVKTGERLELAPSARLWGNVEAKILAVAPGALLNGKCNMKNGGKGEISKELKEIKEKEPMNKDVLVGK
ncbi:MAG: polymer-forming cytoskeletal protein [bacterium]|nr:polymer-forming cytoskeletal protein [bacterium]